MAFKSFQPLSLSMHLPARHQMAFVPFRFCGQTNVRYANPAALPSVSRSVPAASYVPAALRRSLANVPRQAQRSKRLSERDKERSCSVFMFPLLCDEASRTFPGKRSAALLSERDKERSCSVFMFPLLCDPASRTFIQCSLLVSERSVPAASYTVSSCFHCLVSETRSVPAASSCSRCFATLPRERSL